MPNEKVSNLFHRALKQKPENRTAYLRRAVKGDEALRIEVEKLLKAHDKAGDFLESGAVAGAARKLARSAPLAELEPGDTVGDFVIQRRIGSGGLAVVYLATQKSLGREVALKVSANEGTEARSMAPLDHDNIVKLFSETTAEKGGLRLLCMQYVPGSDLDRVMTAYRDRGLATFGGAALLELVSDTASGAARLGAVAVQQRDALRSADPVELILTFGAELSDALQTAHQNHVLHLDVKPANILLSHSGRPLLADFNVSLRREGKSHGESLRGASLRYVAPEQIDSLESRDSGVALNGRADVYSLGIILQEMLSLSPHWRRTEHRAFGDELARILAKATAADPSDRFSAASDLAASLRALRTLRGAGPPSFFFNTLLRHPWKALSAATVLPAAVALGITIQLAPSPFERALASVSARSVVSGYWGFHAAFTAAAIAWLNILYRRFRDPSPSGRDDRARQLLRSPLWLGVSMVLVGAGSLTFLVHAFLSGDVEVSPPTFLRFLRAASFSQMAAAGCAQLLFVWIAPRLVRSIAEEIPELSQSIRYDLNRMQKSLLCFHGLIVAGALVSAYGFVGPLWSGAPRPGLAMILFAFAAVWAMVAAASQLMLSKI